MSALSCFLYRLPLSRLNTRAAVRTVRNSEMRTSLSRCFFWIKQLKLLTHLASRLQVSCFSLAYMLKMWLTGPQSCHGLPSSHYFLFRERKPNYLFETCSSYVVIHFLRIPFRVRAKWILPRSNHFRGSMGLGYTCYAFVPREPIGRLIIMYAWEHHWRAWYRHNLLQDGPAAGKV